MILIPRNFSLFTNLIFHPRIQLCSTNVIVNTLYLFFPFSTHGLDALSHVYIHIYIYVIKKRKKSILLYMISSRVVHVIRMSLSTRTEKLNDSISTLYTIVQDDKTIESKRWKGHFLESLLASPISRREVRRGEGNCRDNSSAKQRTGI